MTATTATPAITRPNGKPYRPRKVITYFCEDIDGRGCIVLGTHDLDRARQAAMDALRWKWGMHPVNPRTGWFRDSYDHGGPTWIHDPVRGRAGIAFDASDDPEETEPEYRP